MCFHVVENNADQKQLAEQTLGFVFQAPVMKFDAFPLIQA